MGEHPIFPDGVELAREHLLDHLDVPVTVAMTVQDEEVSKRHASFVRLRFGGGADSTRVSGRIRLLPEAWANTSPEAHDLAHESLAILRHLPDLRGPVYKIDGVSMPVDLPDPDSGQWRFTYGLDLYVRGEAYELSGS